MQDRCYIPHLQKSWKEAKALGRNKVRKGIHREEGNQSEKEGNSEKKKSIRPGRRSQVRRERNEKVDYCTHKTQMYIDSKH